MNSLYYFIQVITNLRTIRVIIFTTKAIIVDSLINSLYCFIKVIIKMRTIWVIIITTIIATVVMA